MFLPSNGRRIHKGFLYNFYFLLAILLQKLCMLRTVGKTRLIIKLLEVDKMTIYFNPYLRGFRRRATSDMLNEMDSDYEAQISFPIDIKSGAESYELKALLPAVDADDLEIQIVNEVVTISGLMKVERDQQADYLLAEIPSGRFHRVVSLPTPLDSSKVEATLENGILTLNIPKAEEARPKTIKIQKK